MDTKGTPGRFSRGFGVEGLRFRVCLAPDIAGGARAERCSRFGVWGSGFENLALRLRPAQVGAWLQNSKFNFRDSELRVYQ